MDAYVPDIGETFTVTRTWEYRRWQWKPFPWYSRLVIEDTSSYRVTSWMRRRSPRPEPRTEEEAFIRQMIDDMIAEGKLSTPRGFGPDQVPLEHCLREEAEYVSGYGVGGTIQRVTDVTVTGRVSWDEKTIQEHRDLAIALAGEPLT